MWAWVFTKWNAEGWCVDLPRGPLGIYCIGSEPLQGEWPHLSQAHAACTPQEQYMSTHETHSELSPSRDCPINDGVRAIQRITSRSAEVGGGIPVSRLLPSRHRRMIPWQA
ncbi:hypothetical protein B7H17_09530 [Pseudomonas putida]|uniref:Uncharacterized protein n=2 Tax=Pseudomonas putida TaxID=303 RepID=A0A1X0ZZ74_PSEPU|nr:hypothetical protein B7H17_09530 [Pseudomonas putida]